MSGLGDPEELFQMGPYLGFVVDLGHVLRSRLGAHSIYFGFLGELGEFLGSM